MVATDRNAREGRPVGLYGNAFCRASEDAVKNATKILDPPVSTNILAMEAPAGGYGPYRRGATAKFCFIGILNQLTSSSVETILDVLTSCFTGYLAIRADSVPPNADSPIQVSYPSIIGLFRL